MYQIKQNKEGKWIITVFRNNKALRIFDTLVEAKMFANEHFPNQYEIDESEPPKKKKHTLIIIIAIVLVLIATFVILYFTGIFNNIFKK